VQIKEVQEEYQGENSINPALMWEMIKLKIREKSMAYAVKKKGSVSRKVEEIEQIIAQLEKEIKNHLMSEEETEKRSSIKNGISKERAGKNYRVAHTGRY